MKCDEARAGYLSGEPTEAHNDHLATCSACLSITSDLDAMRSLLDDGALWEEPKPTLEDTVVSLIAGTSRSDGGTARPSARRRAILGIAAAIVVVAGAAAGLAAITRTPGPDWEVAVPGTDAAPDASAVVRGWVEPGGTRLEFDITGLDPAPPASIYEVWFSRDAIHISAGSFTSTDDTIEMWTGIARRDFPRIWVTIEPIDDDESPSPETVLDTG